MLQIKTYFFFRRMGIKPATAWKLSHRPLTSLLN